jgi:hypothetical protein
MGIFCGCQTHLNVFGYPDPVLGRHVAGVQQRTVLFELVQNDVISYFPKT